MSQIAETVDYCGYYDASWYVEQNSKTFVTLTLAEIMAMPDPSRERWPVRNRAPREPIGSQKRAIIHERDGGQCHYCGVGDQQLVIDHIIPRSAFREIELSIADRSDNLQSACWDCNETRSNFESIHRKRLGVVTKCWYCVHPEYASGDFELELPYPVTERVYCGLCGISNVPSVEGWVL